MIFHYHYFLLFFDYQNKKLFDIFESNWTNISLPLFLKHFFKLIIGQLQRIRELGVDLAIDDFGTGYSSLSYLKKFPINILKIDRSFIQDLDQENSNAELVKGILSMAKSLRLTVVAEGVEEQTQIDFLARHNCTYIQGFFYSKPLTSEQLVTFIKNTDALDKSLKASSFTGS